MINIAVMGHGTVGEGICRMLDCGREFIAAAAKDAINVKYVLESHEYPQGLRTEKMIFDIDAILEDKEVTVVAEAIGGESIPFNYVSRCLKAGKSVVTSNKELVAAHGKELLDLALENNVNFLFGASVGGGIPILRSIRSCFISDEITSIEAILNGTTNYILTKMSEKGETFEAALKKAQDLGYAEQNPENDVEGCDTARKLAILLSVITGKTVDYKEIPREGISGVTTRDIESAKRLNCEIKLIACARIETDGAFAFVGPALVKKNSPLSNVRDAYNAVTVKGRSTGDIMLYGMGAGKMPTASAAVADIIDCIKYAGQSLNKSWNGGKLTIKSLENFEISEFVAVKAGPAVNSGGMRAYDFVLINDVDPVMLTPVMRKGDIDKRLEEFSERGIEIVKRIPII